MEKRTGINTVSPAMPGAVNYHRWIEELVSPHLGQNVLEIGIGHADYTRQWMRPGRDFMAIDYDAECVELHRKLFPAVPAALADLNQDSFIDTVGASRFDSIICLNVLEHIDSDVAALARMGAALKPGGEILLIVPAHQALYGRMDEIAGHFRRYSSSMLSARIDEAGLEGTHIQYFNPLGGLGWWANSRFYRPADLATPLVQGQVAFFDRYVQPFSRLLNPLTARFFGQSLFAVARKPIGS